MFRPLAALMVAVVAAGCLSPPNPSGPPGPGQEVQDPMVVRVGFGEPGVHIEAEMQPAVVLPGQSVTVQASVVNAGGDPFVFQDCRKAAPADQDDRGQTWGYAIIGGDRAYEALYQEAVCPEDTEEPSASLGPGERETFVRIWGRYDTLGAPPGPMWANLTFHGLHASLPFRLGFGEGGGEPTLDLHANRTTLRAGERVLVEATVHNPTQRYFRHRVDECGRGVALTIATSQGTAVPPQPMCMPPSSFSNVPPGETLKATLSWDGNWYDQDGHGTPDPGDHTVLASYDYTDGDGRAGSLHASMVLAVE